MDRRFGRVPDGILWEDGMDVSSEHFEETDSRLEKLIDYRALLANPFSWGVDVLETEVDPEARAFRVIRLEAAMPDGTIVRFPREGEETALSLPLENHAEKIVENSEFLIYLGVPNREAGKRKRYISLPGRTATNERGDSVPLHRKSPRPVLFAERPTDRYSFFPLASLTRLRADIAPGRYIPPTPSVERNSEIWKLCRKTASKLRDKAVFVAERTRGSRTGSDAASTMERRDKIRALIGALSPLEAILDTPGLSPFVFYDRMQAAANAVSALDPQLLPPRAGGYRHDDLRSRFEKVQAYILQTADRGVSVEYEVLPLTASGSEFSIRLEPEWKNERLIIGVRRGDKSETEAIDWMESCGICSRKYREMLSQRRVRGAARSLFEGDEKLSPPPGTLFFEIRWNPEYIEAGEELVIDAGFSGAKPPPGISLYIRSRLFETEEKTEEAESA